MTALKIPRPSDAAEKKTRTVVDTILVTPEILSKWVIPPFQRPVRENDKVRALAEELKNNGGVWPGIVTLGIMDGKTYVIDGQHRKVAFGMSGLEEGYTDVRMHFFQNMADMGQEFVNLNSQLVRMRPDDILRGLEASTPALQQIRERCPYIGYGHIRMKGTETAVVSMAAIIRAWKGCSGDSPRTVTDLSAAAIAMTLTEDDVDGLTNFMDLAHTAFGSDPEYYRLWGSLNLILCMWLYRNLVMKQYSAKSTRISRELFKKCLMCLSTQSDYLDWLVGRKFSERDRSPAYSKVKSAFAARILQETGGKPSLPAPSWSHS